MASLNTLNWALNHIDHINTNSALGARMFRHLGSETSLISYFGCTTDIYIDS